MYQAHPWCMVRGIFLVHVLVTLVHVEVHLSDVLVH
jgi:hypothetical protein